MKNNNWILIILIIIGALFLPNLINKKETSVQDIKQIVHQIYGDIPNIEWFDITQDNINFFGYKGYVVVNYEPDCEENIKGAIRNPNEPLICYKGYSISVVETTKYKEMSEALK